VKTYYALDIGGTQIRVALYPEEGTTPLRVVKIPTQGNQSALDRIISLIAELWPKDDEVCGISVAVPGPCNPKEGIIYSAPNVPGWTNLTITEAIQKRFDVPVWLGNDANLAALGEWQFGAGIGHHDLLYITVSTGIGGGIILDDRLVLGAKGLGGELGHVTYQPLGPTCGCGHRGHLEAVASGTAIARDFSEKIAHGRPSSLRGLETITTKDISLAAKQGDPLALETFDEVGKILGRALAGFLHIFNPSIIIIGGGVSRSGELILNPIIQTISYHVISPEYVKDLEITTAALGDDAGLLGALALARKPDLQY
jgi:glucokinase